MWTDEKAGIVAGTIAILSDCALAILNRKLGGSVLRRSLS
jgi:hypothetical protein